jgi:Cobalamin-independent synthase, N-terminal domain
MTIIAETSGYPRIRKNLGLKKALEAFFSWKLETNILLQTAPPLQNIVKAATILGEEANAS